MVAIYTHGLPQTEGAFGAAKVTLCTLSDYDTVVESKPDQYVSEAP